MKRLEVGARPAPFFPLLPSPLLGGFDLFNTTFELASWRWPALLYEPWPALLYEPGNWDPITVTR